MAVADGVLVIKRRIHPPQPAQDLADRIELEAADRVAGKRTLVVLLGPQTAKWAYLLIAIVAYGWLLGMVGNDTLPQKSAAAAMTLVLSFTAARDLLEYASQPAALEPAIKRTILAANLHGLVLAGALMFG